MQFLVPDYQFDGQPLVSEEELQLIPIWAQIAFIARAARRMQPLFNAEKLGRERGAALEWTIRRAEDAAANAKHLEPYIPNPHGYDVASMNIMSGDTARSMEQAGLGWEDFGVYAWAFYATEIALIAHNCAIGWPKDKYNPRKEAAQTIAYRLSGIPLEKVRLLIRQDFDQLREAVESMNWDDNTPVSPRFFSYHSNFDAKVLIEVGPILNQRLAKMLAEDPRVLRTFSPHQFEQLIAALWNEFGFLVELTQKTRDGGRDIVAIHNGTDKAKYLIECKRYSEKNRVGIGIVQRLNGVVQLDGANKGIIATTSHFTQPALDVINSTWHLEGRDLEGIARWLDTYQALQMYRKLGLDPPSLSM